MIGYTRNKKLKLCDLGGNPCSPEVALSPLSRVEILSPGGKPEIINVGETRWTKVRVLEAPAHGREGYLPIAALSEYSESQVLGVIGGTNGITRREYGSDALERFNEGPDLQKSGSAFGGSLSQGRTLVLYDIPDFEKEQTIETLTQQGFPVVEGKVPILWESYCPQCGQDARSHRLVESVSSGPWAAPPRNGGSSDNPRSQGTLDDAHKLYLELAAHFKETPKDLTTMNGMFMLGILHVEDDTVYAAHSGKQYQAFFRTICDKLRFTYCDKPNFRNAGDFKTRGGEPVTQITKSDLSTCAAPKLICKAILDGKYPYAMSEIWFDPADKHGDFPKAHTIESCDKCAKTVPYLLCP